METKVEYQAGPITTMRTDPQQELRDANAHIAELRKQILRLNAERNDALMREDQLSELSQRLAKRLEGMRQERNNARQWAAAWKLAAKVKREQSFISAVKRIDQIVANKIVSNQRDGLAWLLREAQATIHNLLPYMFVSDEEMAPYEAKTAQETNRRIRQALAKLEESDGQQAPHTPPSV